MHRLLPAWRATTHHSRRSRPTWRALPCLFLGLSLLATAAPLPAAAAGPAAIPQGPLPVGDLKPIEFSYMTIEGTVSVADGGTLISTVTRTRLRNPDKKTPFERQVTFPGLPVSDVKIGTQNGGLSPAEGSEPWTLALGPDGDAVIEGRQYLAVGGPLVDLALDWGALASWGAPLGAARLTLRFPGDTDSEQLLAVDPAPTERDPVHLTWSYEKLQPAGKIHVLFVAPQYWRPVHAARQATSGQQVGVADYLALAAALRPLAEADGMPPAMVTALQAEILSALRRAVAAGTQDPRAHDELAQYLRAHANGDRASLAEAVSEFKAAYDLAQSDGAMRGRLLAALEEFIAACRQAGDNRGLLRALDVAEAIGTHGSAERAAAYAGLVAGLLDAGRVGEAEATIVAGFGQAALDRYAFFRPHFASVDGEIETRIGERIARFTLVPAQGAEEKAQRDVASLVEALSRAEVAQVKRSDENGHSRIEVAIPFADAASLRAAGQALARAVSPDADPALLLVAAALGPADVDYHAARGLQADRLAYAETANLGAARQALDQRREQARPALDEAGAKTDDVAEAARRRWALALLQRYEADWQALAAGSQVTYRLLPPEDIVAPHWTLAWGEQRSFAWTMSIPRLERVAPYVIGVAVLLLVGITLGLVWWRRRLS